MRRCTHCFRFHPGHPTFCNHCGRSFGVRICSRGHRNARGVTFCAECGSPDLSTPAPPASLLHHLSGAALYLFASFIALACAALVVLLILRSIDWVGLFTTIFPLILMLGFLYWTTTLLPGPVRKLGKAAGKGIWRAIVSRKEKRH